MKKKAFRNMRYQFVHEVVCDHCKEVCTNTFCDIYSQHSFCDEKKLVETICYGCYKKEYGLREKYNREQQLKQISKENELEGEK